jgi:hypothetical protein
VKEQIKFLKVILCVALMIGLMGCTSAKKDSEIETTTLSPEKTVAIHAGKVEVYLDEAKYYAYTAQATYETYFITENKELDWNSEMKEDTTWQQGVKSLVLDDICRRECMYAYADEYNVSLTDAEQSAIEKNVKNYLEKTSEKLISRINIDEKRLKFVFEKKKIAEKVEEIMTACDENLPDQVYEKWKTGNTVTAEKSWDNITFDKAIFTLEDIQ